MIYISNYLLGHIPYSLVPPCMQSLKSETEAGALMDLLVKATAEMKHNWGSWIYERSAIEAFERLSEEQQHALLIRMVHEAVDLSPLLSNVQVEHLKKIFTVENLKDAAFLEKESLKFDQNLHGGWLEGELRDVSSVFINFLPNLINLFLFAFSFFDEGKQPDMIWDVYLILDIYTKFLMLPGVLVVGLGFFFTSTATVWIVAGATTVVALGALYGYLRYLRPFPQKLSYDTENWTLQAQKGLLPPAAAREDEIYAMLRHQTGEGVKKHVLLVGGPGCGKTTLAKAAARKLAETHPEKQVYAVPPAVLAEKSFSAGPSTRLSRLKMQLGRNASQGILFIDEFHSVVTGLGDHLKTVLDDKVMTFWAATTLDGFNEMMKNPEAGRALAQRFNIIFIKDPEDPDERIQKLFSMAAAHINHLKGFVQIDPEAVEYAINAELKGHGQPRLACDLLEGALARARQNLEGAQESSKELKEKRLKKERLLREYRMNPLGSSLVPAQIVDLSKEIEQLELHENTEGEKLKSIARDLVAMKELEKELYALALSVSSGGSLEQQRRFIEIRYLLRPSLQEKINAAKKEVRVTEKMVEVELEWRKNNQPDTVDS